MPVPGLAEAHVGQQPLGTVVEEEDVDAVWVELGAHRGNAFQQRLDVVPERGNVLAVIDEEHGVEAAEEGERVAVVVEIDARAGGCVGRWRNGWPFRFIHGECGFGDGEVKENWVLRGGPARLRGEAEAMYI